MADKTRLTRQGIPDLNHYGPKPSVVASAASKPVEDVAAAETPLAVPETVAEQPSSQERQPPFDGQ